MAIKWQQIPPANIQDISVIQHSLC